MDRPLTETLQHPRSQCIYSMSLKRGQGYCRYLNMELGILHRTNRRQGCYVQRNKEAGLANLIRSGIYRGAVFSLETPLGEKAMVDIFCTHYQHRHSGPKKALPFL